MGRPDVHLDRRVAENHQAIPRNNVRSTPSLDLSTLFDETSETKPMDPKTMAAVRAGKENYLPVAKRIYFAKNKNQDTALHVALKGKHEVVASYLVSAAKSLSFVANRDGFSPLYLAIEAGHTSLVTTMCHGTNELSSKVGGRSIVHAALKANRKDILDALLSKDASLINLRDEGRTSLSFGASIGYYQGFSYLFDKNRDKVYVSDDDGLFPTHMAAKYGHVQILEEILKHCPEAIELLDRDGQNILHLAAKYGKLKVIKFILSCCKDKNKKKLINEQDVNGNTPLHLATINWHPKVVSMFTWDHRVDLVGTTTLFPTWEWPFWPRERLFKSFLYATHWQCTLLS